MTRTALYRHYDAADRLLYVGITDCLSERDRQHKATSGWHCDVVRTETQWCLSRAHAVDLERVAIKHEAPLHNVAFADFVEITPARIDRMRERVGASGACTQAAHDLIAYIASAKIRQGRFADKIGVSAPYMSQLLSGARQPSLDLAIQIERATQGNVAAASWVEGASQ